MDSNIYRYSWFFGCLFLIGCENPSDPPVQPETAEPIQQKDYSAVPELCIQYRELIEEVADCPARRAAMMEQESSCKKFAHSSDDGRGLFQFTGDDIGEWVETTICRDLGPYSPYDPAYAIKCGTRYAEYLTDVYDLKSVRVGEMRYNGGYWVIWEMNEAVLNGLEPTIDNAFRFCGTLLANGRKRASKWCKWNYDYFKHIERRLPNYVEYERGLCNDSY